MTADSPDSHAANEAPWWRSGWLKGGLIMLALVVAFYIAEDWLGAAIWKKAQAEIAASGQSLDPEKYIPPSVPDEQNFAALPLFRIEVDPRHRGERRFPALEGALKEGGFSSKLDVFKGDKDKSHLPYLGLWKQGDLPDLPAIRQRLLELTAPIAPSAKGPSNPSLTDLFSRLCPILAELRAAYPQRSLCRFDSADPSCPPWEQRLPGATTLLTLVEAFDYDEHLALLDHRPDLTLDDIKIVGKLSSALGREPSQVAGVLSLGIDQLQLSVIAEGLVDHAWTDAQLADLGRTLDGRDELAMCQFGTKAGACVRTLPMLDDLKLHRSGIYYFLGWSNPANAGDWEDRLKGVIPFLVVESIPDGWIDEYKAHAARFYFLGMSRMVDPVAHRAYPERDKDAMHFVADLWVHTDLFEVYLGVPKGFARCQVRIDEARIACRLERYRLAHSTYPAALADLIPAYGPDLPHDVMSGEPYRYRLNPDGTYLLYSIGWNQKDDGGKEGVPSADGPDWVWPNQPGGLKSK